MWKHSLGIILLLICSGVFITAKETPLSSADSQSGWVLLFDGESLFGLVQDGALFHVSDGILASDGTASAYLRTTSPFTDFVLKLDYRVSGGADAAVFIRTAKDTMPTENGYQIRLGDSDQSWPAGSIVQRGRSTGFHPA